jgi:cellulose synthase/poly-beta-1,6-N-acetylglucosamine synthase-like glycosyltransferase
VVVASHDRRERLRAVLEALGRQSYPFERFEAVLVVDGGRDGSADMARSLELPYRLQVHEQDRAGAGAGRNRGVREATSPVVVWLDDDVVPEPAFLAAHARAHRDAREPRFVLGYYPAVVDGESLWALTVRAWWEDHFRRKAEDDHQWTYVDFVSGNVSVTKRLFLDTGGFDETFSGRREDWEYGIRLLRSGVPLAYEPRAIGRHHPDTSIEGAIRNCRKEGAADVRLATLHPQVIGHLPLAFSPYLRRDPRHRTVATGPVALGVLESMRLRRRWRRLLGQVYREAYAMGLADAISRAELRGLVGSAGAPVSLRVDLGEPSPVSVPGGAGPVELELYHRGRPLARLEALEPQGQWDWRRINERVVWFLADGDDAREALPPEGIVAGLLETAAGEPAGSRTG